MLDILHIVEQDAAAIPQRNEAGNMEEEMNTFNFVFYLHMMIKIFV